MHTPEPVVDLREFGASSLNFIVYVFIDDISETVRVRTDLSMATVEAFAEAGIEIPFTQTDVNVRNIGSTSWSLTMQRSNKRQS